MVFYKDINFFTPKVKPEIVDAEVARQELAMLFNTRPTERPFDINYGIKLDRKVFDLFTIDNANSLYIEISSKVKKYVKSVTMDERQSYVRADEDAKSYEVVLIFKINGASDTSYRFTKNLRGV